MSDNREENITERDVQREKRDISERDGKRVKENVRERVFEESITERDSKREKRDTSERDGKRVVENAKNNCNSQERVIERNILKNCISSILDDAYPNFNIKSFVSRNTSDKVIKQSIEENRTTKNKCTFNNSLNILYENVNGIFGKRLKLRSVLLQEKPDIFFMTETKIVKRRPNLKKTGYILKNFPRKHGGECGGGIGVCIRKDIWDNADNLNPGSTDNVTGIRLKGKNRNLVFAIIYAPCVGDGIRSGKNRQERELFFKEVSDLCRKWTTSDDDLIVLGDFNAKLKFNKDGITQMDRNGNSDLLERMIADMHLINTYDNVNSQVYYTREERGENEEERSKSIIDYVFTRAGNSCKVNKVIVHKKGYLTMSTPDGTFSDHNTISFRIDNDYISKGNEKKKSKLWTESIQEKT